MTSWEPELAGDRPPLKPGHVWLTRRRWDAYFLAAFVAVVVGGIVTWWFTADLQKIGAGLLPLVPLWLTIRWGWPREGSAVRTAESTPGMVPLLKWLAVWGSVGLLGILPLGIWVPLESEGVPLTWSQALILIGYLVAWFAGLLLGVHRIEARFKKPRPTDPGGLD